MIAEARRLNPGVEFVVGDARCPPFPDSSVGAAIAFYSLIHLGPSQLITAFRSIRRVLKDGGRLIASFHRGDEVRHLTTFLGSPVSLEFHFYEPPGVAAAAELPGVTVD